MKIIKEGIFSSHISVSFRKLHVRLEPVYYKHMEINTTNQKVFTRNLAEKEIGDVTGSPITPQAPLTPFFKVIKSIGIFSMIAWVPFLFLVVLSIGLIGAGAGKPASFYQTYGDYLLLSEFILAVISAAAIYNSKKYITALTPLLLLIIGLIGLILFDMEA